MFPDSGTRDAISGWLDIRGHFDGPLLLAVQKNGQIRYDNGRMSDQTVYDVTKFIPTLDDSATYLLMITWKSNSLPVWRALVATYLSRNARTRS